MQTQPYRQAYRRVVLDQRHDPRRVFCATCDHTELIHGDDQPRRCLYSVCECTRFVAEPPFDPSSLDPS